jgi:hypothetical protein
MTKKRCFFGRVFLRSPLVGCGLDKLESLHGDEKRQDMRRSSATVGTIRATSSISLSSINLEEESKRSKRKNVLFSTVEIQEYAVQLGDNPATAGVPITIGWEPQFKIVCDIDEYESLRPPSRRSADLSIPSGLRVAMLHKQGTPMRDILAIKKENKKIRRARTKSVRSVKWDGVDEALESASRKVKKVATKSFWMLS